MNRITALLVPVVAALAIFATGCGYTAAQACEDHGGVRANSVERENDGGAEARCNDNTEIENDSGVSLGDKNWVADD